MPSPTHIIGAGVAGLGIAWRLAQGGAVVHVYDKAEAGRGASHAAAGMLAGVLEVEPGEETMLPFALESQRLWPGFAAELKGYSGIDPGYRETGTLFVAVEEDDLGVLEQRQAFLQKHGHALPALSKTELRQREPYLSPRVARALYSAVDHQADNRALVAALLAACCKAGVIIYEHSPVERMDIRDGRVEALHVNGQRIAASQVIVCAGAWSGGIQGIPAEYMPPVFPLKGQMLALQMDARMPILKHVLWTPRLYMVPREDGRLIIGATMEDKGFDANLTGGGMLHLLRETFDVLPGMEELPLIESWTGFRPTSPDDAPILGSSGINGLSYATGQHRNGILFAPLIADAMSAYIRDGRLPDLAEPFTMRRFKKD
jgi:glycine oxidase